ncbi:MAG: hypothetical protein M1819_002560 [Sarea resinae]|nr:MAG: hypothetical protein M1819_002560 [Sarea resinae]
MADRLEKHQLEEQPQQEVQQSTPIKDEEFGRQGSQHIEDASPDRKGKRTFGANLKNHFKRFWWVHVIVTIVVTLCLVLPIVYCGFHSIAQRDVNRSALHISSMSILSPTPSSFHLVQSGIIENNSSYHPHLSSFNASLFLEGTESHIQPFAYMTMPAIHATRKAPTQVDQTVAIADPAQFEKYSALVLGSESYRLALRGKTRLHEMSFPTTTVNYNEVVTLKGLNSLAGFNITSFKILSTPASDGANLVGQVYIPNPSIMTLELGNITQTLYIHGTPTIIGHAVIPSLTLVPGNNTAPFRATTNQTLVLEAIASTYRTGVVPVDIVATGVLNSAGEHLAYYEIPLAATRLRVSLDVGAAVGLGGVSEVK